MLNTNPLGRHVPFQHAGTLSSMRLCMGVYSATENALDRAGTAEEKADCHTKLLKLELPVKHLYAYEL